MDYLKDHTESIWHKPGLSRINPNLLAFRSKLNFLAYNLHFHYSLCYSDPTIDERRQQQKIKFNTRYEKYILILYSENRWRKILVMNK